MSVQQVLVLRGFGTWYWGLYQPVLNHYDPVAQNQRPVDIGSQTDVVATHQPQRLVHHR